jgi:tetratricopeptide (TPR) repeat protein
MAAWLVAEGCAPGTTLAGQSPPGPASLDWIEAAVDSGRVVPARTELERWFAANQETAPRADVVRARYLRARLTSDADSARGEYLWVAVDGRSDYSAAAWLRLAQLSLAESDPQRAVQDLERLRADYPQSTWVADSWYWTGVAFEAAGDLEGACRAWGRAGDSRSLDPDVRARLEASTLSCEAPGLRWTVQLGAFRDVDTAAELGARASNAGFPARVTEEEGLYKVRVGRFVSPAAAREMAERLKTESFSDAVVLAESSGGRR